MARRPYSTGFRAGGAGGRRRREVGREWRRSWGWSPAPAARQGHYSLSFSSRSSRFGAAGSFCFIFIFFSRFRSRSELPAPRLLLHNASHSAAPGPASPGPASSCPRPGGGAGGGRAPPGWQRLRPCAAGALQARLPAAAAAQLFYCSPFLPPPTPSSLLQRCLSPHSGGFQGPGARKSGPRAGK